MEVLGTQLQNYIPDSGLYPLKEVDDLHLLAKQKHQNPFPEHGDLTEALIVTINIFSKYFISKLKLFSTSEIYESEVAGRALQSGCLLLLWLWLTFVRQVFGWVEME